MTARGASYPVSQTHRALLTMLLSFCTANTWNSIP